MTIDKAIYVLQALTDQDEFDFTAAQATAIGMAVEALCEKQYDIAAEKRIAKSEAKAVTA